MLEQFIEFSSHVLNDFFSSNPYKVIDNLTQNNCFCTVFCQMRGLGPIRTCFKPTSPGASSLCVWSLAFLFTTSYAAVTSRDKNLLKSSLPLASILKTSHAALQVWRRAVSTSSLTKIHRWMPVVKKQTRDQERGTWSSHLEVQKVEHDHFHVSQRVLPV